MCRHAPALAAFALATAVAACGPSGHIRARARNTGTLAVDALTMTFDDGSHATTVHFPTVAPGQATAFQMVDDATSCYAILATVGGKPAKLTPVDCVGEHRLVPGDWTWVLNASSPGKMDVSRVDSPPGG